MGQPAACENDQITATDIHILMVPSPGGPVPTPTPHPFNGRLTENLSSDVRIGGRAAAVVGSGARNMPPHVPSGPGTFQVLPQNQGTIMTGSATVRINGKPAARVGDTVQTCQDPAPNLMGQIVSSNTTVMIGG